jgi:hypothetical protein
MDLVGRKLGRKGGAALLALFSTINGFVKDNGGDDQLAPFVKPVQRGLETLQSATMWLAQHGIANPNDAGAGATDYLRLMGIVVVGWMWARMAKLAQTQLAAKPANSSFYQDKLISARYWMERMMPECSMLLERIQAGSATLMAFEATQ